MVVSQAIVASTLILQSVSQKLIHSPDRGRYETINDPTLLQKLPIAVFEMDCRRSARSNYENQPDSYSEFSKVCVA